MTPSTLRAAGIAAAMLMALGSAGEAVAQQTQGYIRRDGTYVAPSFRTPSNGTRYDNYSTRGNTNPFTGQRGSVNPMPAPYRAPRTRR